LSLFDGVVTLNDDPVPVILGLEDSGITMSIGSSEIGDWPTGEFSIDEDGDGGYTITAESETLRFVPNDPMLFAAGLRGGAIPESAPEVEAPTPEVETPTPQPVADSGIDPEEGPEPKPATKVAFYVIAAVTVLLGLWALISLLPL